MRQQIGMSDEQAVIEAVLVRWPDAAEIHVQSHIHTVYNRTNTTTEGNCVCAVEGPKARKQYTASTVLDLLNKVVDNKPDW